MTRQVSLDMDVTVHAREPVMITHMGDSAADSALGITDPKIKAARKTVPMTEVVGEGGITAWTPTIPAGHLRGRLRRLTFQAVTDAILADARYAEVYGDRPYPWTVQDFLLLVLGGTELEERKNLPLTLPRRQRRANPQIGLWGAAAPTLASRAHVGHLYADQGMDAITTLPGGHRKLDFLHDPDFADQFPAEDLEAVSRAQAAVAKRSQLEAEQRQLEQKRKRDARNNNDTSEADTRLKQIAQELEQLKADAEALAQNTIERPLEDIWATARGTTYRGQFRLPTALAAEAGLFIEALARFAAEPRVGGGGARGFGVLDGEITLYERDSYGTRVYAGRATFGDPADGGEGGGFQLIEAGDQVQNAMTAWQEIAGAPLSATHGGETLRWHRSEIEAMDAKEAK